MPERLTREQIDALSLDDMFKLCICDFEGDTPRVESECPLHWDVAVQVEETPDDG